MTAPAPIAAAIEEARKALVANDALRSCCWGNVPCHHGEQRCLTALRSLLLALDADDRLAKAEAALRRVEAQETAVDGLRPELYGHAVCIARRYFAEKGDDRG